MTKEDLKKANDLDYEIEKITIMLHYEEFYIADRARSHECYTTKEISDKLHNILMEELARLEKEFAEL